MPRVRGHTRRHPGTGRPVKVTGHDRAGQSTGAAGAVSDENAAAAASSAAAAADGARAARSEASQAHGRMSAALDAMHGPDADDYFAVQDALIDDAQAAAPVIPADVIGWLIGNHRDADVRVYALRHPHADPAHLARVARDRAEPRAIREEAAEQHRARGKLPLSNGIM